MEVLRRTAGSRTTGPLFQRRRAGGVACALAGWTLTELRAELGRRVAAATAASHGTMTRPQQRRLCRRLWVETGVLPEGRLRGEFMKLTKAIGLPEVTAPKTLRHLFATALQEANVDPRIRNELMGHLPEGEARGKGPLRMTGVYTPRQPGHGPASTGTSARGPGGDGSAAAVAGGPRAGTRAA